MARLGDTLYVVLGSTLAALDVSDPAEPRRLGPGLEVAGRVNALACTDGLVVLALGRLGVSVVEVGDGAVLVPRGSLVTTGAAVGVAVEGDLAFVADDEAGLLVVDLTDRDRPTVVGRSPSRRTTLAVAARGGIAYVAESDTWEQIVRVVDVGDPAAPRELAMTDVPSLGNRMTASDRALYVLVESTNVTSHVRVVDVADPRKPRLVRSGSTPDLPSVSRSGPAPLPAPAQSPIQAPGAVSQAAASAASARSLALDGDRLAVGFGSQASLLSLASPLQPAVVGSIAVSSGAFGVAVRGGLVSVAAGAAGVLLADLSQPTVEEIGRYSDDAVGLPNAIDWLGDRLYVADQLGVLRVYDMADPAAPQRLVEWTTLGVPNDVAAIGDYAVLALALSYRREGTRYEYTGGLEIVHLGDPRAPFLAAQADKTCGISDLDVDGTRAYVAELTCSGKQRALTVFDLTRPWWPEELGGAVLQTYAVSDVKARGAIAYLTDGGGGTASRGSLWTVDVGGAAPAALGRVALNSPPVSVDLHGRHAVIAMGAGGLALVDVGDPAAPALVHEQSVGGLAADVAVDAGMAYVAAGTGGVSVWDLTVPTRPRLAARYDTPAQAGSILARDGRVIVAMPEGMIQVLELSARPTATPAATVTTTPIPADPSPTPTDGPTATPSVGSTAIYLPTALDGRSPGPSARQGDLP